MQEELKLFVNADPMLSWFSLLLMALVLMQFAAFFLVFRALDTALMIPMLIFKMLVKAPTTNS